MKKQGFLIKNTIATLIYICQTALHNTQLNESKTEGEDVQVPYEHCPLCFVLERQ